MKISLNEIKKLVEIPAEVSTEDLVKLIGSRLVEVEETVDLAPKYAGAWIVKVAECEPIPDTHLHLCRINVGRALSDGGKAADALNEEGDPRGRDPKSRPQAEPRTHFGRENAGQDPRSETIQVVCGAPNVRKGMLAVWLAPGAIVPQTYGNEDFKLGVRKLRGYESHGMLAGLDELDLGDDHSGIVEIDPAFAQPGDNFAEKFELNDVILDIENKSLTHRPDTFGLIGFAREVAGILGIKFAEGAAADALLEGSIFLRENTKASTPATAGGASDARKNASETRPEVNIENKELCARYSCAVIEMNDATETTKYLTPDAVFLAKAGMRSISKIVDVTNILMLKTGQPLHAFDYDKFVKVGGTKQPKVGVRLAKSGEELQLLDGKTIACTTDDIVITSGNKAVALAGAMGGASTEIDASTKKVFLESATFSLYNLRKTQMAHGIFSEAITRFTKGQPAGQTAPVLNAAIDMLGGELITTADEYPGKQKASVVEVSVDDINNLLGSNYETADIVKTLENVGFEIQMKGLGGRQASVSAKSKLNGAPTEGSTRQRERTIGQAPVTTAPWDAEGLPTGGLPGARSGVPEICLRIQVPYWRTDIHIKEDIIEEVGRLKGFDNIPRTLPLRPFIGAENDPMLALKKQIRGILSDNLGANEVLTYSFVNKKLQQAAGEDPKNSYEITNSISPDLQVVRQSLTPSLLEKIRLNLKAGHKDFTLYEMNQVTNKQLGQTSDHVPVMQHHLALVTTGDYYRAKAYLENLLAKLGVLNPVYAKYSSDHAYFEPLHSAAVAELGVALGEIRAGVLSQLKIAQPVAAFELDLTTLQSYLPATTAANLQFSKFPSTERDLTLRVPASLPYTELYQAITSALSQQAGLIYQVSPASIYQKTPADTTKNISFNIKLTPLQKTLQSTEISAIMEEVVGAVTNLKGGKWIKVI